MNEILAVSVVQVMVTVGVPVTVAAWVGCRVTRIARIRTLAKVRNLRDFTMNLLSKIRSAR
jgi:hypothetical protein